jgi:WD40 repeat protein
VTELKAVTHPRQCPYVGLDFYTEELGEWFFGRDTEATTIITNLRAARLTLLHADSGVGKSSLLRAGVGWRLGNLARRGSKFQGSASSVPIIFSSWTDDPVRRLVKAIGQAIRPLMNGGAGPELPADRLDTAIRNAVAATGAGLVIILDQFEEYFNYKSREDPPERFADQLASCVNDATLRVNFLIAIREDAYAGLGSLFGSRMANVYGNYLGIEYLDRAAARAAICRPIDLYNAQPGVVQPVEIEDSLVERVLDEARDTSPIRGHDTPDAQDIPGTAPESAVGRVATPLLQLVMDKIWAQERAEGSHVLRLATLEKMEGVDSIVDTHLRTALSRLTEEQRQTALDIFDHLVTPSGGKIAESVPQLATRTGYSEQRVGNVMKKLDQAFIVRPVAAPPDQDPVRFRRYEIFHDVLAPAINRAIASREEQRRARRLRRLAALAGALVVVALGLGAVFFWLWHTATTDQQIAESRQVAAGSAETISSDPELSAILALHSLRLHYSSQAEYALRRALPQIRSVGTAYATASVAAATFDPANKNLVTVAVRNGPAEIWNVKSGGRLRLVPKGGLAKNSGPQAVAYDPAGNLIAVGYGGGPHGMVALFSASTGKPVRTALLAPYVQGLAFSDNTHLAIATTQDVQWWSFGGGGGCCRSLLDESANSVAVDPKDTSELAAATSDGTVVWAMRANGTAGQRRRLTAGQQDFQDSDAGFSATGSYVVTASLDGKVRVYNRSGRVVKTFSSPDGEPYSAAFSPQGLQVAAGFSDGATHVWDEKTGASLLQFAGNTSGINTVGFSANGQEVLTGGEDGSIRVFSTHQPELEYSFAPDHTISTAKTPSHPYPVYQVSAGEAGILTVDSRGEAHVFDNMSMSNFRTLTPPGYRTWVKSAQFSRGGDEIVTADADGSVDLWKTFDNDIYAPPLSLPHPIKVPKTAYYAAFNPSGSEVVVVTGVNTAAVVSTNTGRQILPPLNPGHDYLLSVAAFSPDGQQIVTGDDNGQVEVWNATTGRLLRTLGRPGARISDVAYNHAGNRIVTTASDGNVTIWGDPSYQRLKSYTACPSPNSAAFNPAGAEIVVACGDGSIPVYAALTGKLLTEFSDPGIVNSATFSPDGRQIITAFGGFDNGGVRIFNTELATTSLRALERMACHRITRPLTRAEQAEYLAGIGDGAPVCPGPS